MTDLQLAEVCRFVTEPRPTAAVLVVWRADGSIAIRAVDGAPEADAAVLCKEAALALQCVPEEVTSG